MNSINHWVSIGPIGHPKGVQKYGRIYQLKILISFSFMIKKRIVFNNFSDYQFTVLKAKGSFLWNNQGKKLIDFASGWNVTNLGWNHPEITQAMIKQIKTNTYIPQWTLDPIQEKYAEELAKSLPKGLNCFTRETSGASANIMALKTARAYTGKKKIVSFKDTFHGSLYSLLELGYSPNYAVAKAVSLNFQNNIHLDYPRVKSSDKNEKQILTFFEKNLEKVLKDNKDVAAIVCEAGIITGWGSTFVAPKGFLTAIRKLTKKYHVLLILDEVGTGFSRCGKLFGLEIENVIPDIITFAKGMVNGAAAIGAMGTTKEIAEKTINKSNPQATFGWMPDACAASLKTLEIHKRDRIWEKAKKDGDYLLQTLQSELKNYSLIEDINGIGMEIGVHLQKNEKINMRKMITKAEELGLHLAYADDDNFQIMPPLTIERNVLNKGVEIFVKLLDLFQ